MGNAHTHKRNIFLFFNPANDGFVFVLFPMKDENVINKSQIWYLCSPILNLEP